MKTYELDKILKQHGFKEELLDSGINYTREIDQIKLICYIEPDIEVEFISIYSWDNNDVKGTYNIPIDKFEFTNESVITIFRKTKNNLPQCIGDKADTYEELERALQKVFNS